MAAINFDTLTYARRLENAGCDKRLAEEQALAQAAIIASLTETTLATKDDLKKAEAELRADIQKVETELRTDLLKVEKKLDKLSYDLALKLGSLMVVLISSATALLGFMIQH